MTNEQKAAILDCEAKWKEKIAHIAAQGDDNGKDRAHYLLAIAALLRECAGMMRERGGVQWVYTDTDRSRMTANYKGWMIHAYPSGWWCCLLDSQIQTAMEDVQTLPAAQAAAVAWVDEQEGKP